MPLYGIGGGVDASQIVNNKSFLRACVFFSVTSPTQQLKIFKIRKNLWISYIVRIDVNTVVNYHPRIVQAFSKTTLTQTANAFLVSSAAILPRL